MLSFSVIFSWLNPWYLLPPGKQSQVLNKKKKKHKHTNEYEKRTWKRIIKLPLAVIFHLWWWFFLLPADCIFKSGACLFELIRASLVVQMVESACSAGDPGSTPGSGRSLEKGIAIHSSILVCKIPWTEKPCRPQSMGWQRVGHTTLNW